MKKSINLNKMSLSQPVVWNIDADGSAFCACHESFAGLSKLSIGDAIKLVNRYSNKIDTYYLAAPDYIPTQYVGLVFNGVSIIEKTAIVKKINTLKNGDISVVVEF